MQTVEFSLKASESSNLGSYNLFSCDLSILVSVRSQTNPGSKGSSTSSSILNGRGKTVFMIGKDRERSQNTGICFP